MNLSHAYSKLVQQASENNDTAFIDRMLTLMKSRGHLSLLPQIVRMVERAPKTGVAKVTVKNEADAVRNKKEITAALSELQALKHETVIDAGLVGGFTALYKGKVIDKSYRSALVSLYQNTIKQ